MPRILVTGVRSKLATASFGPSESRSSGIPLMTSKWRHDIFDKRIYFGHFTWRASKKLNDFKAVFTRQAFELSRAAMQLRLSVTWKRVQRSKPDTGYVTSLWRHKVTSRMTLIFSPWLPRSQLCCDVSAADAHWPLAQWHTSLSGHRVKGWPVA